MLSVLGLGMTWTLKNSLGCLTFLEIAKSSTDERVLFLYLKEKYLTEICLFFRNELFLQFSLTVSKFTVFISDQGKNLQFDHRDFSHRKACDGI